jgi:hypothetical protein
MDFLKNIFGKKEADPFKEALEGPHGAAIIAFREELDSVIEKTDLKEKNFAMWLPAEGDEKVASSPIIELWNSTYTASCRHWTYITADLLKVLKVLNGKTGRMELPREMVSFPFQTRDREQMLVSFSHEKGIRFHMAESTPLAYRVQFLDKFLAYCTAWATLVDQLQGEPDEDIGFKGWWDSALSVALQTEKQKAVMGLGKLVL